MDQIDAVIVGAGLAGLSCAYRLADAGLQVIVVERGDTPGSKNVTGGRLYFLPVKDLAGDMLNDAPFERKVVRERWSLLGSSNSTNIDFTSDRIRNEDHSFTVLRSPFDSWLASKVMEKGVFVIPKYRVDEFLWDNNTVIGIKAGKEEIYSSVVVAADGVLSFMAGQAGLRDRLTAGNYAIGVKEVVELPAGKINDRFNVEEGEGAAQLFVGDVTGGLFGGGFLYTNKESLSLGVVVGIQALTGASSRVEVHAILDAFKDRYEIRRLIDGGRTIEYAAHIIPEAGYNGIARLCGNGILVAGDAAGFALNLGTTVRGMEFAIASGMLAAETIIEAKKAEDFSQKTLSAYETKLRDSFVMKDMFTSRKIPSFLDDEDLFAHYPQSFSQMLDDITWFGKAPRENTGKILWKTLKSSKILSWKGLKKLYRVKNL